MAIITRRYLFEGPPLEVVQNQTDPGLTLSPMVFKVAFDATFDDAVANVAAMDRAMAASGLVPDPGADTTTPPTFNLVSPNGSQWKLLVDNAGVLSIVKVI